MDIFVPGKKVAIVLAFCLVDHLFGEQREEFG